MKKYLLCGMVMMSIFLIGCDEEKPINSFEECAAAGNPVIGSYPRQCRAAGRTFVEEIEPISGLTIEEAEEIAQDSECTEKGYLTDSYFYNENTLTWWIDLDMKEEFEKEYCSPACVVDEKSKTAEINWRCTGALP